MYFSLELILQLKCLKNQFLLFLIKNHLFIIIQDSGKADIKQEHAEAGGYEVTENYQ